MPSNCQFHIFRLPERKPYRKLAFHLHREILKTRLAEVLETDDRHSQVPFPLILHIIHAFLHVGYFLCPFRISSSWPKATTTSLVRVWIHMQVGGISVGGPRCCWLCRLPWSFWGWGVSCVRCTKNWSKGLQHVWESELAAFRNGLIFRDSCLGYICHLCLYFAQTPKLRYMWN